MSPTLPIIPLSPLLPTSHSSARVSTAQSLHHACITHGFFYLDLTGFVSPSETEELRLLAQEFFSLPEEEKEKIWLGNGDWARGYQKLNENVTLSQPDAHEAIDFYAPSPFPPSPPLTPPSSSSIPARPLSGENQWPPNPLFRTKFERWVGRMKELGMLVMEAMALGLGLPPDEWASLRDSVEDTFWVMRVIGYPPLPGSHPGVSCGAHKDYGCLTFLWSDPTPNALQVFVPSSSPTPAPTSAPAAAAPALGPSIENGVPGTWISADPIEGCVVCNIGEMWEVWTRGLYRSTLHRVVHRGSNYRISIPFFYEPSFHALITPLPSVPALIHTILGSSPPESVEYQRAVEAQKAVYNPVVYGEFLMGKVGGNFDKTGGGRYGN